MDGAFGGGKCARANKCWSRCAAISRGAKALRDSRGCRTPLLRSACSFLKPISAPAQVPLAFRNFFARWLKLIVLFALIAFLPCPRLVVRFRFLWRIARHKAQSHGERLMHST